MSQSFQKHRLFAVSLTCPLLAREVGRGCYQRNVNIKNITMINRVKIATLLVLIATVGTVSFTAFGQTSRNSPTPVLKGKNVIVYLEDADFGILAERFAYDSNTRLVDIQDEKPKITPRNTGVFSAVHFVNPNTSSGQPVPLKKVVPRSLGTNTAPKPLLVKPQVPAMEELSFGVLSQVPVL